MKKLLLGFLIILSANVFAQQKGISYQAVIINPNSISAPGYNAVGTPLANKSVCMSFQILNAASQTEYQETQTISTDQYGMVNLVIGTGTKTGGTAASLAAVTWSLGGKSLVVAVNTEGTCSNYTEISRQALNYVPYAMYADDANIKDGFITTAKLADGSVTDAKVAAGINKTKVGLGNVDNTSDANKQISTATQAALNLKEDAANKSNDNALGTSTSLYPTQAAVKAYVDAKTGSVGSTSQTEIDATQAGAGLAVNGNYTPKTTANYISAATSLADADNKLDAEVKTNATAIATVTTKATNIQTELDATQTGAGLAANGNYAAKTTANYISTATSLADADNKLDVQVKTNATAIATKEDSANKSSDGSLTDNPTINFPTQGAVKSYVDGKNLGVQTEIDATQTGAGLAANGNYIAKVTNNYISTATSLTDADDKMDAQLKMNSLEIALKENSINKSTDIYLTDTTSTKFPTVKAVRTYVDGKSSNIQTELDSTQNGAGLSIDGKYVAKTNANYISTASSLADADNKLDAQVKTNTTNIATKEDSGNKSSDVNLGDVTNTLFPTQAAVKSYVDTKVAAATIADADASTKGKIQLAGDLAGTATAPVVANNAITGNKIANNTINNTKISDVDASKITGNLTVQQGGTGANSLTGYVYGNGTSAMTSSAKIPVADVTGAIKSVNGSLPNANGNVNISFGYVTTGTLAGLPTNVGNNGDIYVISGDASFNNGRTFISDGATWKEVTINQASTDSRYVQLSGSTMQGDLSFPAGTKPTMIDAPVNSIDLTNKVYVDTKIASEAPDATTTLKGKIMLAGDLSGTASLPTIATGAVTDDKIAAVGANKITGILDVAHGGSGANNLTGYLKGNGTSPYSTSTQIPVTDISGAIRTVNGIAPTNGNVAISLGSITTGQLVARPSNPGANGNMYIVSSDPTAANNGKTFISDGAAWQEITSDQSATDARYVQLSGSTMQGDITFPTGRKVTMADAPTATIDLANKSYVDAQVSNGAPEATTIAPGKIQLAGDLAGTATSPTVPGLALKENSANKSSDINLADITNTKFPTEAAVKTYVNNAVALATIPDANASTKGKIQLAGDLGGSAAAPTVPALASKENSSNKSTDIALGISDALFPTQKAVKSYVDNNYLPLAGGTLTGALTGTTITAPVFKSLPQALTAGPTIVWPTTSGLNASVTLGTNSTLAFNPAPPTGVYGTLIVTQPATGGPYTLTLPSSVTNKVLGSATGTVTLSTTANANDILTFYYDGTTCYWNVGQGYGANQIITAAAYSGVLPIANGGTGAGTKAAAFDALSPMTSSGDIIYGGTSGTGTRLAKGTDGQIMMLTGGVPTWSAAPNPGSSVTEIGDEISATAAQTTFTLSQTPATKSKVKMFINGIRISNTAYTLSGNTITYVPANNDAYVLSLNDRIQFDYYY
jgi:hypothetical protein